MNIKGTILARLGWIYILVLLGALGILGKVLFLQMIDGEKWRAKAEEMSQRTRPIPASRGNILDTYGNPIASTVTTYDLVMDPGSTGMQPEVFKAELPGLARGLANMFRDRSAAQYENLILQARRKGDRYLVIRRNLSYKQAEEVRKLPLFRHGKYGGGLILDPKFYRLRPYETLAKRTIGYAQDGVEGKLVGLEGKFDSYLKGQDGLRYEYRLGGDNWIPASSENYIEPRDGFDIQTTLDMNYQDVAENALHNLLVDMNADHGCAVLMEVATGEIRAMANLSRLEDGSYYEVYNYAVGEMHEPGSTFKLPALMAALESGRIDLNDTVNTFNGAHKFHGAQVRDSRSGGYGVISVKEVFEKSSNIGMGIIAERCFEKNPRDFVDRLYSMGLKYKTGIEIDGESEPDIKNTEDPMWSKTSLPFIAHGYEIKLSPIQILTFYNAVANDGKMVAPRIVKAINYHSHLSKSFSTRVIKNSICSSETISKARSALEGVVENGTAKNLASKEYKIAGKTGTAVIFQNGSYEDRFGNKEYRASFVGYFPADKPKYSCIVVVTKPKKKYYGSDVAGVVFQRIADKVYATDITLHPEFKTNALEKVGEEPLLLAGYTESGKEILERFGIPYNKQTDNDALADIEAGNGKMEFSERELVQGLVPDVTGMGLTDALPILENSGLKVNIKGSGRIVRQSINPGERISPGQTIELELEFS